MKHLQALRTSCRFYMPFAEGNASGPVKPASRWPTKGPFSFLDLKCNR